MVYLDQFYQPTVIELAQAGDFRAIAYWLNGCLVPQGMWVCVNASSRPGFLQVTVKVQRLPECDRLVRFICYRISQLNSDVIKGVDVRVQLTRTSELLWEQSVRLRIPVTERTQPIALSWDNVADLLPTHQWVESSRALSSLPQQVVQYARKHSAELRQTVAHYLKQPYAIPLGGAALAAFFVGSGIEVIRHAVVASSHSTRTDQPTQTDRAETDEMTVQTAVGNVPVIPHHSLYSESDDTITLALGGEATIQPSDEWTTDSPSATDWTLYQEADVAIASLNSLNSPLLDSFSNGDPDEPSSTQPLTNYGIDVVSLASDRLLDSDSAAQSHRWLDELEMADVNTIGIGKTQQEARRPNILEVKGQRIAYLGYSDSDWDTASSQDIYVNVSRADRVKADLEAVRSQVDWIVVNYHWHQDLTEQPTDEQIQLAHAAVDHGADLVVGYHPTILQGGEIYQGRAIAYSLGSFIFDQESENLSPDHPADYDTAALRVSLRERQMRLEFVPVQIKASTPVAATGKARRAILTHLDQTSRQFETPMSALTILDARSQMMPDAVDAQDAFDDLDPDTEIDRNTQAPEINDSLDESLFEEAPLEAPLNDASQDSREDENSTDSEFPAEPPDIEIPNESIDAEPDSPTAPVEPFITYSEEDESTQVQPIRFERVR
jgi:poly-gamma-glutamate synthesis protein (capsule biosynthesis protein)